jgi:hypothetical protein|tara:strand:- start:1609 stop:1791 length:183 start_codon:yes stop_codon:yes gene_type:complete
MPETFEEDGDNSFVGSIGEDDLQKINVASKEIPQPTQSFFNWLETITSKEKGKSFFSWLN